MGFDIDSSNGSSFSTDDMWWSALAYCSGYIAPSITVACRDWYSNGFDGLNTDQAHKLGATLQCSLDNGSIDKLAHELFVVVYESIMKHMIGGHHSLPLLERKWVDDFISEVKRWIEFLLRCDGFTISCNDDEADNFYETDFRLRRN
jgi:hypothetical protein